MSKIAKIFVILAGSVSIVFAGLFFIREISIFITWQSAGIIHTEFTPSEDSTLTFAAVDSTDFVSPPYPDSGDVVLTMDSVAASLDYVRANIYKGFPPGKEMSLSYIHAADTLNTTIRTTPVKKSDLWQSLPISLLRLMIVLGYYAVAIWAFIKRPNAGAIHALTLFCIAMANLMVVTVGIGHDNIEGLQIPYFNFLTSVLSIISVFFGAFWINLQLLFPKPSKLIIKHPYIIYPLCYLPIIAIILLNNFFKYRSLVIAIIGTIMVQVIIGFIILSRNHKRALDPLEKRQTRLVLWGTGTGLLGLFLLFAVGLLFRNWFLGLGPNFILGLVSLVFLGLLVSPISFAYAFGRYRLLEVEGKIRRGTRFVVITAGLLIVFYLIIYGISELTLDTLGIESRGPVLLIAFLLAIGFAPAQRRIQNFTERRIFPERNRLRQMLRDFLGQASTYADKHAFWADLEKHLKEILGVENVCPVLYRQAENKFYPWLTGTAAPFASDGAFIKELMVTKTCPLMLDEALHGNRLMLSPEERAWLNDRKIALVLPLKARSNLVGFIGLGYKSAREDFNAEDCGILMTLASQVAVAGENIQLLEENIEKDRLEKELGMARRVQKGLLPGTLPSTPGLEIAAKSVFCLEVAGDYYDIINIDNKRTVMAIGDVSGKGAAAALMMSNIQASFRTAIGISGQESGNQISGIVSRINDLIHRNTPADQFITFFVGFYDFSNQAFTYVNAGHNPPLLVRHNGEIELLEKGGLLLGALPNMPYEQATITLGDGDLVFLYTDGVSEAENPTGEMFGEARIKTLLSEIHNLPPDDILARLETEVKKFVKDVPLADDFTALVVKAKAQS